MQLPITTTSPLRPSTSRCRRLIAALTLGAALTATPASASRALPAGIKSAIAPDGEEMLAIQGSAIAQAPIPENTIEMMLEHWEENGGDPTTFYVINLRATNALDQYSKTGLLDPYLEPYIENYTKGSKGCPDKPGTKTLSYDLAWNGSSTEFMAGNFDGSMSIDGELAGEVDVDVNYFKTYVDVWVGCIPWGGYVGSVDIRGEANVEGSFDAAGSLSNTNNPWNWEWELTKINLGSISFWAGPVWIKVGFNVPITGGLTIETAVTSSIQFDTDASASGNLDYNCTFSGCDGSSSYQISGFSNSGLTGDIDGRAKVEAYLDAAVRAYLYFESVAYAQVGVRPVVYADLWGYLGNNCGDRDDDGSSEFVHALTFDLDWQAFLTAKADAVIGGPWVWDDLAHTNRYHIAFLDLIGSDAIEPILHGPATAPVDFPTTYTAQMGSCWPYDDDVTYTINWGDGTSDTISGSPNTPLDLTHTFAGGGTRVLSLTVDDDVHGRNLGKTTDRTIDVSGPPPLSTGLNCFDVANPIYQCDGSPSGGQPPYFPEWRVIGGEPIYSNQWYEDDLMEQFQCKSSQSYTVQFRVFDSAGNVSKIASWSCNGGPLQLR